jgi:hypothetical protein
VLIDAAHKRWGLATAGLFALATAAYLYYAWSTPRGPSGGTWQGLLFGIAGSALMLFAGLIGVRKKLPRWRIGSAQTWLRGHIWLGLLSFPVICYHAGFHLGGTLEQILWAVLGTILVSGFVGLALQQFLPRMLTVRVPRETFDQHVPLVCALLQFEADARLADVCGPWPFERPALIDDDRRKPYKHVIYRSEIPVEPPAPVAPPEPAPEPPGAIATAVKPAAKAPPKPRGPRVPEALPGSAPLRTVYERDVRPFLSETSAANHPLADAQFAEGLFAQLRAELPEELHEQLAPLLEACEERRELGEQQKLHRLLHGWLLLHGPLAIALLVLGIAHVVTALYW